MDEQNSTTWDFSEWCFAAGKFEGCKLTDVGTDDELSLLAKRGLGSYEDRFVVRQYIFEQHRKHAWEREAKRRRNGTNRRNSE